MKYKVHKLKVNLRKEPETLENFINNLKGDVVSIIPDVTPLFLYFGARVRSIIIVEKIKK